MEPLGRTFGDGLTLAEGMQISAIERFQLTDSNDMLSADPQSRNQLISGYLKSCIRNLRDGKRRNQEGAAPAPAPLAAAGGVPLGHPAVLRLREALRGAGARSPRVCPAPATHDESHD